MLATHMELAKKLIVRQLGNQSYLDIWHKMQQFTDKRNSDDIDEIWLVEHPSVFTQGQAGKAEHLLHQTDIPVVQSDRGGQITYHGPGQQVMYVLFDLKRKKQQMDKVNVRFLVTALENCVIDTLAEYNIKAYAKADAPGVYVDERKICSLGLRVRRGCSFHGLALNVNMDLQPFHDINPCGYTGLEMCQLSELINDRSLQCKQVSPKLVQHIINIMRYDEVEYIGGF